MEDPLCKYIWFSNVLLRWHNNYSFWWSLFYLFEVVNLKSSYISVLCQQTFVFWILFYLLYFSVVCVKERVWSFHEVSHYLFIYLLHSGWHDINWVSYWCFFSSFVWNVANFFLCLNFNLLPLDKKLGDSIYSCKIRLWKISCSGSNQKNLPAYLHTDDI